MNLHFIEDESGDVVDQFEFCSDFCHRDYVGDDYAGWNGCNESEFGTTCQNCGSHIPGECSPAYGYELEGECSDDGESGQTVNLVPLA